MRIIIILVIFVRYYKNKERMRRRNRMQRPVNIGGTGRERKSGRRAGTPHDGRAGRGDTRCGHMMREARHGDNAGDCTQEDDKTARGNVGIGRAGENAALEYLLQNGYKLLERNWHCRHKEVDLIVGHEDGIHIVEVKTRTGPTCLEPERAVNYRKQRNLKAAAGAYLRARKMQADIHFDIISVILDRERSIRRISFIKDAFFPIENERQSITI